MWILNLQHHLITINREDFAFKLYHMFKAFSSFSLAIVHTLFSFAFSFVYFSYFWLIILIMLYFLCFFNENVESACHLFVRCTFLGQVWYRVFRWLGWELVLPLDLANLLSLMFDLGGRKKEVSVLFFWTAKFY